MILRVEVIPPIGDIEWYPAFWLQPAACHRLEDVAEDEVGQSPRAHVGF